MKKNLLILAILFFVAAILVVVESYAAEVSEIEVDSSPEAAGEWTDWIRPYAFRGDTGQLNVSISGTWAGTVTVQRKFAADDDAKNIETYTANTEGQIWDFEAAAQYRVGVASGGYSSGTVVIRLSK